MQRWQVIANEIALHESALDALQKEWKILRKQCQHPKLPQHTVIEEYRDTCPDCGYVAYCYALGSTL